MRMAAAISSGGRSISGWRPERGMYAAGEDEDTEVCEISQVSKLMQEGWTCSLEVRSLQ